MIPLSSRISCANCIKESFTRPLNLATIVLPIILLISCGLIYLIERAALKQPSSLHFIRFTKVALGAAALLALRILMIAYDICKNSGRTVQENRNYVVEQENRILIPDTEARSNEEAIPKVPAFPPSRQKAHPRHNGHRLPGLLTRQEAAAHMHKNILKARNEIAEGAQEDYLPVEAYPSVEKFLNPQKAHTPLQILHSSHSAAGNRHSNEDREFISADRSLGAIFDGHGGSKVSDYLATHFKERFFQKLAENERDVYKTFEEVGEDLQKEILQIPEWENIGSTAVITYIDPETNFVYTATLGDSEAVLYRKIEGLWKAIPLSCVRTWNSIKDETRAVEALDRRDALEKKDDSESDEDVEDFRSATLFLKNHGKHRYYPFYSRYNRCINVSRAFGDAEYLPAMSHKLKITSFPLEAEDILILGCDGLWDFARKQDNQSKIIEILNQQPVNVATALATFALEECHSTDNVTVIALRCSVPQN